MQDKKQDPSPASESPAPGLAAVNTHDPDTHASQESSDPLQSKEEPGHVKTDRAEDRG